MAHRNPLLDSPEDPLISSSSHSNNLTPNATPQVVGAPSAEVARHLANNNNNNNQVDDEEDDPIAREREELAQRLIRLHTEYDWTTHHAPPSLGGTGPFVKDPLGKTFVCCAGPSSCCCRCLWPRYVPEMAVIITFCFVVPVAIFEVAVPDADDIWTRVVTGILFLGAVGFMWLGSCFEPGIILPKRVDEPTPEAVVIEIDGVGDVTLDVCRTCNIVRPPRSSHCPVTDRCLGEYDHFCGVTNTCVAARNFRFFVLFFIFATALCAFVCVRSIVAAAMADTGTLKESKFGMFRLIAMYGEAVLTGCVGMCLIAGCWNYVDMTCRGKTLKDQRGRKRFLPDEQDCECGRFVSRICGKMVPSNLPDSPEPLYWIDKKTGERKATW